MAVIDHLILKVNDLPASIAFYTDIMGFSDRGSDGPFQVLQVSPDFQLRLAPWGTAGFDHYAFAVSAAEFDEIYRRVREAGLDYGPGFDSVGENSGPGTEVGARGEAPALYFTDPNRHLIEIRTYERTAG
ncbi:MAG: VOC family protein [Halioglobus sp.]|nr:VOC family protein [Halioglobus sp.]